MFSIQPFSLLKLFLFNIQYYLTVTLKQNHYLCSWNLILKHDVYLYLNLEDKQAKALFDTDKSTNDLLTAIYLFCNTPRFQSRTLLFIDEIQNSPAAVARLRYFYEQIPEIYVIAAGSLLESLIGTHILFPVGRVEYMAVYPCGFDEFTSAMGETLLAGYKDDVEKYARNELMQHIM